MQRVVALPSALSGNTFTRFNSFRLSVRRFNGLDTAAVFSSELWDRSNRGFRARTDFWNSGPRAESWLRAAAFNGLEASFGFTEGMEELVPDSFRQREYCREQNTKLGTYN